MVFYWFKLLYYMLFFLSLEWPIIFGVLVVKFCYTLISLYTSAFTCVAETTTAMVEGEKQQPLTYNEILKSLEINLKCQIPLYSTI